jgi:hypothetical protein
MTKQKYRVIIDENFHFMDTSERYGSGVFETYEEAVAKCKEIIDEFLESALTPTDSADSLYICWQMYGENPFIDGKNLGDFTSRQYVKERCVVLTNYL